MVMKTEIDAAKVGAAIMILADLLTVEFAEISTDDLVDTLEGRCMSCEEAGAVNEWLSK